MNEENEFIIICIGPPENYDEDCTEYFIEKITNSKPTKSAQKNGVNN